MIDVKEVMLRGQEAAVSASQAAQGGSRQAAEEVATKAAAQRALQFAAPLLRVEVGFQSAILSAHSGAIKSMMPVLQIGGTPDDAGRAAFQSLYPALVKLGRVWFPLALREGWAQGNARLIAAVNRRKKSWNSETHLPGAEGVLAPSPQATPATKAPRKPKPDVTTIFDLEWPEIAEYIAERPIAYAPITAQTTVDMFRAALTAGVEDGLGIESIVRNILGQQLPGISRWRATTIASTEILSAGNHGNFQNYRASGVVEKKRWLSTRDARTRESHRTETWRKGSDVVALDAAFVLPSKARLLFPGDSSLGAPLSELVNCRCSIAPEVSMPGIPDFVPGG